MEYKIRIIQKFLLIIAFISMNMIILIKILWVMQYYFSIKNQFDVINNKKSNKSCNAKQLSKKKLKN